MKKIILLTLAFALVGCKGDPKSVDEKISYMMGMGIGQQVKRIESSGAKIDLSQMKQGLQNVLDGKGESNPAALRSAQAAFMQNKSEENIKKLSYQIGAFSAQNLKRFHDNGIKIDVSMAMLAIEDVKSGEKPRVAQDQMKDAYKKLQEVNKSISGKNIAAGKKFLEENKAKPGVKTTASGLQYKVEKAGSGRRPRATDNVTVHYRGTLLDGTEFDSSFKRNKPAQFGLGQVIKGWTEGLQLMRTGAKYTFYIPSELAYGDRGNPGIPGGSTLVFEVELIKVGK